MPLAGQHAQARIVIGSVHIFQNQGISHRYVPQGCAFQRPAQPVLPLVRQNMRGQSHGNQGRMPLLSIKCRHKHRHGLGLAAHGQSCRLVSLFLPCGVEQSPDGQGPHQRHIHRLHKKLPVKTAPHQGLHTRLHR